MSLGREVDLSDDGILWMINRTIFHPRGFGLGYDKEAGSFLLYGDGQTLWSYDLDEKSKKEQFETMLLRISSVKDAFSS